MIIDKDSKPQDTVYYVAACAAYVLTENKENVETLYRKVKEKYNQHLDYDIFLLSLNFLFLIKKIKFNNKESSP